MKEKKKFVYKRRDPKSMKDQANESGGGLYDRVVKSGIKMFNPAPREDSYRIRILPPTWTAELLKKLDFDSSVITPNVNERGLAKHFGFEYWRHSNVGPDNSKILCRKMLGDSCRACEESTEMKRDANTNDKDDPANKAAYALKAKKYFGFWLIDREHEDEGPMFWGPSWVQNRDIAAICTDEETGEVLFPDDPDEGRDVLFKVGKKDVYYDFHSFRLGKQKPLSDDSDLQDEWLEFIEKHPIPSVLGFKDEEYIDKLLSGKKVKEDDEDGPKTRAGRRKQDDDLDDEKEDDDDERKPSSKKASRRDIDDEDEELDESEDDDGQDDRQGKRGKHSASEHRRERDDDQPSARRNSDRDERDRRQGKVRPRSDDDEDEREDRRDRRQEGVLKKPLKKRRDEEFTEASGGDE